MRKKNLAAIISRHDPAAAQHQVAQQQATVRLLEEMIELADAAMKGANRYGIAEYQRIEELKEARAHLAVLRGKGGAT